MTYLVNSSDVFKETELQKLDDGTFHCQPSADNIGSLPTLFSQYGVFNHEANYYPDFVEKVKQTKAEVAAGKGEIVQPEIQTVRTKLKEQKRIKENFKAKYDAEREKLALFAAAQHHLNDKLVQALARVDELEYENAELKEQLVKLKRSQIVPIKNRIE
ncbi:hypothetical protein [Vibrio cidicii]|uniref:hypothetical protein n=1 Tax=Vibrio cidicii TaxID=1763883 RepID=UPI001A1A8423|nr:hypothetical protein [Vibrio cidicii]MBG0754705.1 hypothetical protein [Vibrio cidicii]